MNTNSISDAKHRQLLIVHSIEEHLKSIKQTKLDNSIRQQQNRTITYQNASDPLF